MKTILCVSLIMMFGGISQVRGDVVFPQITDSLKQGTNVTLVIEGKNGQRIRNLLRGVHRKAGKHSESWDGLDDAGQPAATGTYRWRGLTCAPVHTYFKERSILREIPRGLPCALFSGISEWELLGVG